MIEAARAGSQAAFAEIVERYQPVVVSLAYALTGSVVQAEEIAQEAFLTAWRRLPEMQWPDRFRGWIFGITRNLGRYARRRERGHRPPGPQSAAVRRAAEKWEMESAEPSPLEWAITREEESVIRRALSEIPETYRLPLVLYYVEQYSMPRVAETLQVSEDNARQRLSRGRRMLRANLESVVERAFTSLRARKPLTAAVMALSASGAMTGAGDGARWALAGRFGVGRRGAALAAASLVVLPLLLVTTLWHRARSGPPSDTGGHVRTSAAVSPASRQALPLRPVTPLAGGLGVAAVENGSVHADDRPEPFLSFDFEDGVLPMKDTPPGRFSHGGQVVPDPFGRSRFCVIGTPITFSHVNTGNFVGIEASARDGRYLPLFRHSSAVVISFDYWLDSDAPVLGVQINNPDQQSNFYLEIANPVHRTWAHASVRPSDFVGVRSDTLRMEVGDSINYLLLMAGQVGGGPFYVDNIRVEEIPARPSP